MASFTNAQYTRPHEAGLRQFCETTFADKSFRPTVILSIALEFWLQDAATLPEAQDLLKECQESWAKTAIRAFSIAMV